MSASNESPDLACALGLRGGVELDPAPVGLGVGGLLDRRLQALLLALGLEVGDAKRAEALEKESDAVIGQQLAEQLPQIVEAAAKSFANVDNLTVLNGAQGIGEIMNQVIGQAGPALDLARQALGTNGHANGSRRPASSEQPAPPVA
jgi:hypothetical protein